MKEMRATWPTRLRIALCSRAHRIGEEGGVRRPRHSAEWERGEGHPLLQVCHPGGWSPHDAADDGPRALRHPPQC